MVSLNKISISISRMYFKDCEVSKRESKNKFISKPKNVHNIINSIKTWKPEVNFIITNRLSCLSTVEVRNRLKNIFLKVTKSINCWNEIERLLCTNNIPLFGDYIYQNVDLREFSPLRRFILEIYLIELDRYINQLLSNVSFSTNILTLILNKNEFHARFKFSLINSYTPIKLNKLLTDRKNINLISRSKYSFIVSSLKGKMFESFSNFTHYLRYLDNFIFAVMGTKKFSYYTYEKISNFIKSNLHFDVYNYTFYKSFETKIYFLGYNIKLSETSKLKVDFISKLISHKKYFLRIMQKLELNVRA